MNIGDHRWTGWVFTVTGDRIRGCEHAHADSTLAKNCAARLAKRWAELEAARGVGMKR